MTEKKTWEDYDARSVKDFLKHFTSGDVGHGGRRYICTECGAEYRDIFGVERCWRYSHGPGNLSLDGFDRDEHVDTIEFDENGVQVDE